jgi:hypothetical protein
MTGIGGEMGTNVFESTGEMRNQYSEFEFFHRNNNEDDILPIPQRSPVPGSPASLKAGPNTLSRQGSMTLTRRVEESFPYGADVEQRPHTSQHTSQHTKSRPVTPITLRSIASTERERQNRLGSPEHLQLRMPPGPGGERRFSPESQSQNMAWQGRADDRYNPNNMI